MKQPHKSLALLRAGSLAAVLAVVVSGVSFAALRSQNNLLNGNSLASASADLKMAVHNDGTWYTTMNGYQFYDVAPGGTATVANSQDLYLKNGGSTNLQLSFGLNPARLSNPNGMKLDKAHLVLLDSNGTKLASPTLSSLWDAYAIGSSVPVNITLPAKTTGHYLVSMQLDDGAVDSTTQAAVDNIDLVLSGLAQNT